MSYLDNLKLRSYGNNNNNNDNINNNNINNRNDIRRGIVESYGQIKCSLALVGNHLEVVS